MARTDIAVMTGSGQAGPPPQAPPLDLRIRGAFGPAREMVRQIAMKSIFERPGGPHFEGRTKTPYERRVIREAIAGLNVLRSEYGLGTIVIPTRLVHVMDPQAFDTFMRRDRDLRRRKNMPEGSTAVPHSFVKRREDRPRFIRTMTHEIVHMAAYVLVVLRVDMDVDTLQFSAGLEIAERRNGIKVGNQGFVGLNEAITESLARSVRERMMISPRHLSHRTLDAVLEYGDYEPQVIVLRHVIGEVFKNPSFGMSLALWDYFTGSSDFLRLIRKRRPAFISPLRAMTGFERSALKTAVDLELKNAAAEIRRIIRTGVRA